MNGIITVKLHVLEIWYCLLIHRIISKFTLQKIAETIIYYK